MKRLLIPLLIASAIIACFSSLCLAAPVIAFDVDGQLHIATPPATVVDDIPWYTSGPQLGELSGTLFAENDGLGLTLLPSTLELSHPHPWTFEILGGHLEFGDPAGGVLDYSLLANGHEIESGTFFFASHAFTGSANTVSASGFDLWGQNFLHRGPPTSNAKHDFIPMGLDLSGEPIPTPEPGSLALLAGGLGALGLARRRRRTYDEDEETCDLTEEAEVIALEDRCPGRGW